LYRRIPSGRDLYSLADDGTIKISSQAFYSGDFRISVDRAELCGNNPRYTLGQESGGVVSLVTRDVRSIVGLARNDSKGRVIRQFAIDVEPVPLPDNPAHAEIYAIPGFSYNEGKVFRRLRERLVQLAENRWEIRPDI
jgi:hypothetical protein